MEYSNGLKRLKGLRSQVGCREYVDINYENILPLSCYQDYRKCRIESAFAFCRLYWSGALPPGVSFVKKSIASQIMESWAIKLCIAVYRMGWLDDGGVF